MTTHLSSTNGCFSIAQPSLSFFNFNKQKIQPDIWQELINGLWRKFDVKTFLINESLPPEQLHKSPPLFPGFQQILPGTLWDVPSHHLQLDLYHPRKCQGTLSEFYDCAEKFFDNLHARRIGVHLSGGLDSSIIICLLQRFGIPHTVIGFQPSTFEFRTERCVQRVLLEKSGKGRLIPYEEHPFYTRLTDLPRHQLPTGLIKSWASCHALAEAFREEGCDVVLSGQGGDSLFVDAVPDVSRLAFNIGNEFENPDEIEMVYVPRGIRLLSFFSDRNIIDCISKARAGQKEDSAKLWARQWLKEILPMELSQFSYCADFFALAMQGLDNARPIIKRLFEEAYDATKDPHFSPRNTHDFLSQDIFSFEYGDYIRFCSLMSVAVWYHSMFNNG